MAITNIEGFELYSATVPVSAKYAISANTTTLTTGRFTGQAFRVGGTNGGSFNIPLPATISGLAIGLAFRLSSLGDPRRLIEFRDSSLTTIAAIHIRSDGTVELARSTVSTINTLITSSSGLVSTNTWYYIEVEFTRNASTGAATVYLNGSQVATGTGLNTGSTDISNIGVGASVSGSAVNADFDDIYITNSATRVGECRIDLLKPDADDSVAWSRSTGSTNYTLVNEGPSDGDTSYIYSSTVSQVDQYSLGNLGVTPTSIYAVRAVSVARKDDAATKQIRAGLSSGGTTSNGATKSLSSSYAVYDDFWATDPNTSAAWTISALDALKLRMEVIT